jgi:hypothetical protein
MSAADPASSPVGLTWTTVTAPAAPTGIRVGSHARTPYLGRHRLLERAVLTWHRFFYTARHRH